MSIARAATPDDLDYEAVVIGAGVAGIYQLYRLRELGVRAVVLEAGDDVGGTWYWNRYPGARFDSESYSYGYSFSPEVLQEWRWKERFAGQSEVLEYLNYVVDKFGLRTDMQFNARVLAARFDGPRCCWRVTLADGRELTTQFLVTAIGMLSTPTLPKMPGVEEFEGLSFHTYHAPQEPVDYVGKRVAVIGTGATGVQVISTIASKVSELTVFQRRPNWCAPLHNGPISDEEMEQIRASYDEIFDRCRQSPNGFIHSPDRRGVFDVPAEEREKFWEELYSSPGFGVWLGNFVDVLTDERANAEFTAFIADKIRQRVDNPAIAEKLIPRDHGFGTRRVPLETNYYEVYNQDNVRLVDLNETPIERVTSKGVKTTAGEHEFDIIVYATGFDAITGSFDRIEFTGRDGVTLRERWQDGPRTFLGIQTHQFPNLLILAGPQGASVSSNFPRMIEEVVDWVTGLIGHARSNDYQYVEATAAAEDMWGEHVRAVSEKLLQSKTKSWFTGFNSNVEGHDRFRQILYTGGSVRYRRWLAESAERNYEGFVLR